ncbi:hypothetical protein GIB67_038310 [Kingdonia uniflora]|uniref:Stress up-regulated Nod 19 n=1 Tax=Kingdonia uniflora TaxID=39325 RepID=A0A7J7KUI2_9MAGN|nr:hypothetical protein GIB67_038310 [Kingdonia uniflora]
MIYIFRNMTIHLQWWLLSFVILQLISVIHASQVSENGMTTSVLLSPKFELGAGSVENKFYYNIDFPRGHIAIKEFNAEVVDQLGNPIPLYETYLHHWVVMRYYGLKDAEIPEGNGDQNLNMIPVRNSGVCGATLAQYFGLGSETRRTVTYVPDPYGIEVGNPGEIPDGYEERWLLNVHAIDTRGVEDRLGCTECKCDLYNVTKDEYGRPLSSDYTGGLDCCYDQTQCRLKEGFQSIKRGLYLRYKVKWIDWEDSILPVKIYIFDVTDTGKWVNDSTTLGAQPRCKIEYEVEACGASGVVRNGCIDTKKTSMAIPAGGYVVYGVAHQHSGGRGSALYGQDGRLICSSMPIYGQGNEVGNEKGYIVGMSTCYPQPGSLKIADGEVLVLESNYSSSQKHTGVMGLFYILVTDQIPNRALQGANHMQASLLWSNYSWAVAFVGLAVTIIVGVGYIRKNEIEGSYEPIIASP